MNPLSAARSPKTSPAVLAQLAREDALYIRRAVAENPNAPADALTALADDEGIDVRRAVARHANSPAMALAALARDSDSWVRMSVARNPNSPAEVLSTLSTDKDSDVRWTVAGNPNTPPATLIALARDKKLYVRESVGENPSTPIEVLSAFVADDTLKASVASNPNASVAHLVQLATNHSEFTRICALRNPGLPALLLDEIVAAGNDEVRISVAESSRVAECPEAMDRLAHVAKSKVRVALAKNSSVPESVLQVLANDKLKSVRDAVARNPNAPSEAKSNKPLTARERAAVVLAQDLTPHDIEVLREDKYHAVQVAAIIRGYELGFFSYQAALNLVNSYSRSVTSPLMDDVVDSWTRSQSPELLKLLPALQADQNFASAVSAGRCTEESKLLVLAELRLPLVCWAIANSEPLTEPLLRALADAPASSFRTDGENYSSSVSPGVIWAGDYVRRIPQVIVALHPDTPPDVIEELARARSKYVRAAVVSRDDLPDVLRAKLAKDKQPIVRAACAGRENCTVDELARFALDPDVEVRRAAHDHARATAEVKASAALLGLELRD